MRNSCLDCNFFCKKPIMEIDTETHVSKKVGEVDGCSANGASIGIIDISERRSACALFKSDKQTGGKEQSEITKSYKQDMEKRKAEQNTKVALKDKTIKQLREELDAKGIKYAKKYTKAKLIDKLTDGE